jgi:hypothetical protein
MLKKNYLKKNKIKRKFSIYNKIKLPYTILNTNYFKRKKEKINIDRRVSFIRRLRFKNKKKTKMKLLKNKSMTKESLIFRTKKNRNKSKFIKNRLIIIKMYKNILFIKEKVKIKICQKKINLYYINFLFF